MKNSIQVKRTIVLVFGLFAVRTHCQNVVTNDTKIVGLQDPSVDGAVKSALENGSVSEIVVRKDLLLFPVNAPNLVIAHRHEIHAVPQNNGTKTIDGKPTTAEVKEINEYSLSQVVNDTDGNNETQSNKIPMDGSPLYNGQENVPLLAPGNLLEIPSGFNLTDGLATEKVTLPNEIQNFSIPKESIVNLLSKSLVPPSPTESTPLTLILRRSIDSTTVADVTTVSDEGDADIVKRSADDDDYEGSSVGSSSSSTEYYDNEVTSKPRKPSEEMKNESASSKDDMEVAEDIVFRPLFRYRQETQFRNRYARPRYRNYENRYRYDNDNSDYD